MNNKIMGIVSGVLSLGVVIFSGMTHPQMSPRSPPGGNDEFEVTGSSCMIECSYPAPSGSWDMVDCDDDTGCSCECNPSATCSCSEEKKSKYRFTR